MIRSFHFVLLPGFAGTENLYFFIEISFRLPESVQALWKEVR